MGDLIPILGVLAGIVIPIAVFIWLYHDEKNKRQTVLEIAKQIGDPEKLEQLLHIFDERKKKSNRLSEKWDHNNICWYWSVFFWLYSNWIYIRRCWSFGWPNRSWNFDCWISLSKYWQRANRCCR